MITSDRGGSYRLDEQGELVTVEPPTQPHPFPAPRDAAGRRLDRPAMDETQGPPKTARPRTRKET